MTLVSFIPNDVQNVVRSFVSFLKKNFRPLIKLEKKKTFTPIVYVIISFDFYMFYVIDCETLKKKT